MIAMFGWFSEARTFASRWNRAIRSASAANASGRILMATSRSSRVSRARYTSPMPPAPSAESISYGPMRVPGVRAKRLSRIIRAGRTRGRDYSCVTPKCLPIDAGPSAPSESPSGVHDVLLRGALRASLRAVPLAGRLVDPVRDPTDGRVRSARGGYPSSPRRTCRLRSTARPNRRLRTADTFTVLGGRRARHARSLRASENHTYRTLGLTRARDVSSLKPQPPQLPQQCALEGVPRRDLREVEEPIDARQQPTGILAS